MRPDDAPCIESPSIRYRDGRIGFGDIWTLSPLMRKCLDQARKVAALDIDLLLLGETGTGKNLVAGAVHNASGRANGPFIEVNTAAIPATLAEGTLFGHEPGAFTEARTRRRGLFELASGGTLFLDEITNMSPEVQAKILAAVERKRIRRLGAEEETACDVRLICASNADVEAAIASGAFRDDLYFRVAGHVVRAPPLRDRPQDIPFLTRRFIALDNATYNRAVDHPSEACRDRLLRHPWPGNVRELRRRISAAVALCEGAVLEVEHVFPEGRPEGADKAPAAAGGLSLASAERQHIARVLDLTGWVLSHAARVLEISRPTLRKKMRRYGLERPPRG